MDQSPEDIQTGLAAFSSAVRAIPDVDEPPKTTLAVINRRQTEAYWNRLLRYFIDPSAPHGFETAVLDGVLELVAERSEDAEFDSRSADEIIVESEVQSVRGNRPDLLVYCDGGWSVCFELKVTASEGRRQTNRYSQDDFLPDDASVPASQEYHVYVSKVSRPDAAADAFLDVPWHEIADVFDDILLSSQGGATERGTAQLRDFRDTIVEEVTMSDQEFTERQRQKMELYVEHYDEIQAAAEAFEAVRDREKDRWAERFLAEYEPDGWTDDWNCDPSKYGLIYRDDWRLDADRNPVDDVDDARYRLAFQHFVRKRVVFARGNVRFRVYTSRHGVPDAYRNAFKSLTNDECFDELAAVRERYDIDHVTGNKTHAEKYYSFDPKRGPDGFYETISRAFDEFVELAPVLTAVHERALDRATTSG